MKTLDRLDNEEARQALALFSQMEAAAKGRDIDAILAASTNMVAETILARMRLSQGGCRDRRARSRKTFRDHSQILESVSPKPQIVRISSVEGRQTYNW